MSFGRTATFCKDAGKEGLLGEFCSLRQLKCLFTRRQRRLQKAKVMALIRPLGLDGRHRRATEVSEAAMDGIDQLMAVFGPTTVCSYPVGGLCVVCELAGKL